MKPITATIVTPTEELKVGHNRKEKNFAYSYTLLAHAAGSGEKVADLQEIISARFYLTNAMAYCCVWINSRPANMYLLGGGKAGGYGYHRPSAAFQQALQNAGVVLNQDIGGAGDSAIEEALKAIACALSYPDHYIVKAHG